VLSLRCCTHDTRVSQLVSTRNIGAELIPIIVGNVINRPEQYDYSRGCVPPGTQSSGGIWACTIRHHKGTFYVTTTFAYTDKKAEDYSQWVNVRALCIIFFSRATKIDMLCMECR
jgi:beta-xylosidase